MSKGENRLLKNSSVFILTEQNGYFHVLKEKLLFQGAEMCTTFSVAM